VALPLASTATQNDVLGQETPSSDVVSTPLEEDPAESGDPAEPGVRARPALSTAVQNVLPAHETPRRVAPASIDPDVHRFPL
jgi:hypothetical protein